MNRKMDFQTGLICQLTGEKAAFERECPSFIVDEEVIENMDSKTPLEHNTVLQKFSKEQIIQFKQEQNFVLGLLAGLFIGLLGALVWGGITVATNFQIGYMALAIGAAVGFTIRKTGKGIDIKFGIAGAIISLLSCLIGNFFSILGFISNEEAISFIDALLFFDYSQFLTVMSYAFSPIDLLFYGLAGYEGYKFSFRTFTEKDLDELLT